MLATSVTDKPFEWENHHRRLRLAYNSSIHPTTGYSHFYLMFDCRVRMLIDVVFGTPTPTPTTLPQYVADLRNSLHTAYKNARERKCQQLERQSNNYNRKSHDHPFNPGDLIWLHNPVVPRGQSRKLYQT